MYPHCHWCAKNPRSITRRSKPILGAPSRSSPGLEARPRQGCSPSPLLPTAYLALISACPASVSQKNHEHRRSGCHGPAPPEAPSPRLPQPRPRRAFPAAKTLDPGVSGLSKARSVLRAPIVLAMLLQWDGQAGEPTLDATTSKHERTSAPRQEAAAKKSTSRPPRAKRTEYPVCA